MIVKPRKQIIINIQTGNHGCRNIQRQSIGLHIVCQVGVLAVKCERKRQKYNKPQPIS